MHGRAREREHLAGLVAGTAEGRSFAVLVEGPAGIGKSVLLDEVVAGADGLTVLRAVGYATESEIPYAGLSELLAPVLHLRERLADVQRAALAGALALEDAAPHDRFAVPAALLGLLAVVADERPLLVVVDDAHWLDDASREALLFVAQRLVAEGVGIVIAARDSDGGPIAAPHVERLRLAPLEREDARALLRDGEPLAPDVTEALLSASAGNPLALRELPRALSPAQRAGLAPLSGPPASGSEVQAAFERQLEALPAATRNALCLLAAGAGCPSSAVARALGEDGGEALLRPAVDAGLLAWRGGRGAFRHPLLAAAAYHVAASGERRAAHAALAAQLSDRQHRAWQLSGAALGADATAAAALREA
ncbi:AAA family ATPase, partial [Conexibacter stalactiti]